MTDLGDRPRTTWDLLHQDRWWKDVVGRWHDLTTMDPRHRDNLLPYLERNAYHYRDLAYRDATRQFYAAPDDVYEAAMDEFEYGVSDLDWLYATPLCQALRRYADERTAIGKLRTRSHNKTYKLRRWLGIARS